MRDAAIPGANITALARAAGLTRQNVYKHLREAS
jgi:DNA-binding phage protein